MIEALAAALLLGGINTIADVASTALKLDARPVYVLVRVVLICYCVGGIVGARARQWLMGTVGGLMIGVFVAAVYYLLAPSIGWSALPLAWLVFWLGFSFLDVLLQGGAVGSAALQGLAAAVLAGAFYYALPNLLPQVPSRDDPSLWRVLVLWSAAFFPGFVVLFWRRL